MKLSQRKQGPYDLRLHESYQSAVLCDVLAALECKTEFSPALDRRQLQYAPRVGRAKAARLARLAACELRGIAEVFVMQRSARAPRQPLRRNAVDVGAVFAQSHGLVNNQVVFVLLPDSLQLVPCTLHINRMITAENELRLNASFLRTEADSVLLLTPELLVCPGLRVQMADRIKDDTITLNPALYARLQALAPTGVELRHLATGASLRRPFAAVDCDTKLHEGELRLNYYQREILNLVDKGRSANTGYLETLRQKVQRTHGGDDGGYFSETDGVVAVTDDYQKLQLVPFFDPPPKKRTLAQRLCDTLVGGCEMKLSAVRPYKIDDARDIIRLSEDTMTLLGIEETDRVRVQYRNRVCKASAMQIDSYDLMKETNIFDSETDLDVIVGIPAPLRQQLGVGDVETEVRVMRDTVFLFSKNLNIQMLSVLGLLLAVFQIGSGHYWLKAAFCFALLPLIIYISLSRERSKVKQRRRRKAPRL